MSIEINVVIVMRRVFNSLHGIFCTRRHFHVINSAYQHITDVIINMTSIDSLSKL